jgi:hypothetical protein
VFASHSKGYTPLELETSKLHETGFWLRGADETCFDGQSFQPCDPSNTRMYWGVSITYGWRGAMSRQIYSFYERNTCLVATKGSVTLGSCSSAGAKGWGLKDSKLSQGDGKYCVARLNDDSATMARCSEAAEWIAIEDPEIWARSMEEVCSQISTSQSHITNIFCRRYCAHGRHNRRNRRKKPTIPLDDGSKAEHCTHRFSDYILRQHN